MARSDRLFSISLLLVTLGCGVDTASPPVGDVGDISPSALKVACKLSREDILANADGARRNAIERGFQWYDDQIPYSQSNQHNGYRTDCSGFVSMCWELGHSYTTANFIDDTSEWSTLSSFDDLLPADAMVFRSGGSGHIMLFLGWNDSKQSQACVLEQASTAEDMQFRARTTDSLHSSGYHAIRASKFGDANDPVQEGGASSGGSGGAGGSNQQCYCDDQCAGYGDCCADCSGGPGSGGTSSGGTSSGGTSSGGAGGSGGTSSCYCDDLCQQYGDCCSDCGSGGGGGSGGAPACYCDSQCAGYGDCCSDCGSGGSGGSGGGSQTCYGDGVCNPGNDGSGLICSGGVCVSGCHTNAQCPGITTCQSGQCL